MGIVVVGSIAFDSVRTPFGQREKALGGAANYFALAAHFFSHVHMVGIVGEDFPGAHLLSLKNRGVNIDGIERAAGQSFHWQGEYGSNFNEAKTINTELNVFEHFRPTLPTSYRQAETIFLANIDPELQIYVLEQMTSPKIRALDSMNFWIEAKPHRLQEAISLIDILFINDAEIRALTGEHNMVKAIRGAHKMGAPIVVLKRGEYGAMLCMDNHMAYVPAYPVENVCDPTGAGDSFAGGFLGFLDKQPSLSFAGLKQALLFGAVMSSFVIENFSFDRLLELDQHSIATRREELIEIANINA